MSRAYGGAAPTAPWSPTPNLTRAGGDVNVPQEGVRTFP